MSGPLSDVTILDLSRVLAGPYCTMVLAELGARVIKVERPGVGDDSRAFGPFTEGVSGYFASVNRGKQSVALDLKREEDRLIFEALLAKVDVLVENFRPGTLARLGYDWPSLHTRFPALIYGAVSGFGHSGPYSARPAYDMIVQGMGGIMSVTGQPGGPPTRVGTSVGDITAGLFLSTGLIAALYQRAKTGEGQMVDVAMFDSQLAILENAVARYTATGVAPGPMGARHPAITPFQAFEAQDGYLTVAAGNDALYLKLCAVLERPDLAADPRYINNDLRTENAQPLIAEISAILATRTVAQWLSALQAAGVPAGPINDVAEVLSDPQIIARKMVITADDPVAGPMIMAGNPIKLSGMADGATRKAAPALDADRQEILAWLDAP